MLAPAGRPWGCDHGFSLQDMVVGEPSISNGGFDCSSLVAGAFAKGAGLYAGLQWDYGATHPGATCGKGPARGGAAPAGGYLSGTGSSPATRATSPSTSGTA